MVTVGGTTTDDGVNAHRHQKVLSVQLQKRPVTLNIGAFTAPQTDNKLTGSITVNTVAQ